MALRRFPEVSLSEKYTRFPHRLSVAPLLVKPVQDQLLASQVRPALCNMRSVVLHEAKPSGPAQSDHALVVRDCVSRSRQVVAHLQISLHLPHNRSA